MLYYEITEIDSVKKILMFRNANVHLWWWSLFWKIYWMGGNV